MGEEHSIGWPTEWDPDGVAVEVQAVPAVYAVGEV
jgi:hypothetical protein